MTKTAYTATSEMSRWLSSKKRSRLKTQLWGHYKTQGQFTGCPKVVRGGANHTRLVTSPHEGLGQTDTALAAERVRR
jgi:hypothetical protein